MGDDGARRRLIRFRQSAQLEDVPRVEGGPAASDDAADDFQALHPAFGDDDDAVEEELWDLADGLLDGGESAVHVSVSPQGVWSLVSRQPSGYGVLLSSDGAVIVGYFTLHEVKTYGQVVRQKERRRAWEARLSAERRGRRLALEKQRAPVIPVVVRVSQDRERARALVQAVLRGQISEEEGWRRAARKRCRKEFSSELRKAKNEIDG